VVEQETLVLLTHRELEVVEEQVLQELLDNQMVVEPVEPVLQLQ
tara:strand:+ start:115 stop:246 length:132 start_codon:yes stop_codon:yes gene_type:complete